MDSERCLSCVSRFYWSFIYLRRMLKFTYYFKNSILPIFLLNEIGGCFFNLSLGHVSFYWSKSFKRANNFIVWNESNKCSSWIMPTYSKVQTIKRMPPYCKIFGMGPLVAPYLINTYKYTIQICKKISDIFIKKYFFR